MLIKQFIAFGLCLNLYSPRVWLWDKNLVTRSLFDNNPKYHGEWSGESEAGTIGRSIACTLLSHRYGQLGFGRPWGPFGRLWVREKDISMYGNCPPKLQVPSFCGGCGVGHQQGLLLHNRNCFRNRKLTYRKISRAVGELELKTRTPKPDLGLLLLNYLAKVNCLGPQSAVKALDSIIRKIIPCSKVNILLHPSSPVLFYWNWPFASLCSSREHWK